MNKITTIASGCTGMVTGTSTGPLYGSYTNRYELQLVQQNMGSWSSPPTITLLSGTTARTSLGVAATCSFGNPAGYFDGTNYYLAFILENSGNCGATNRPPDQGSQYDLWACYLGASPTTPLTGSGAAYPNCNLIAPANTSGSEGAMLDPQIFSNQHLYVSERDNASVLTSLGVTYDVWSVDDIAMNWVSTPPVPSTTTPYVFNAGGWNTAGRNRGSSPAGKNCEQYYKLTGLFNLPSSVSTPAVRAFFQANDINPNSSTSPFTNVHNETPPNCDTYGAGTVGDAFLFSGIFYADLTLGRTYMGVQEGSNYTQLYPTPSQTSGADSCLTAKNNINCYSEYPWILPSGTRMVLIGNRVTQAGVIDTCVNTGGCKEDFTSEVLQMQLAADYSSSAASMSVTAALPLSNMQNIGSQNCATLLSPINSTSLCGLNSAGTVPLFGNCNHISVDEASQYVTCGDLTSFDIVRSGNKFAIPSRQTMVFSLQGSALNPVVQGVGPISLTGGPLSAPKGGVAAYTR